MKINVTKFSVVHFSSRVLFPFYLCFRSTAFHYVSAYYFYHLHKYLYANTFKFKHNF